MNQHLPALYAVQRIDTQLLHILKKLRSLDPGTKEKEAIHVLRGEHAILVEELRSHQTNLADAELELRSIETKRKQHREQLYSGNVRNPKELDALQHEIEALGRREDALNTNVYELMEVVERLTDREAQLSTAITEAEAAYADRAHAYTLAVRKLKAQADTLQTDRAERVGAVPADLLRRYDSLRAGKHGIGIARVDSRRCSACSTTLPQNTLTAVKETDQIATCDACGRMLCMVSDAG